MAIPQKYSIQRDIVWSQLNTLRQELENHADDLEWVKICAKKIEKIREEFLENQTHIEAIVLKNVDVNSEEFKLQSTERYKFECEYTKLLKEASFQQPENISITSQNSYSSEARVPQIKLPSIELPSFSGDIEKFNEFFNTFKSLIHENSALSSVEKFHYLKASLKKTAAELLAPISITSENYEIAWDLFVSRFQNKRRVVESHLNSIINIPSMQRGNTEASLQNIYNEYKRNMGALRALDIETNNWDILIIHLLKPKLDRYIIREWESQLGSSATLPTLDAFEKFIFKQVKMHESISFSSNQHNQNGSGGRKMASFQTNSMGQRGKCLVASPIKNSSTNTCSFCKSKDHKIYKCSEFLTLSAPERLQRVKSLKLCSNCLSSHASSKCSSRFKCAKCHKGHNTLLHRENIPRFSTGPTSNPAAPVRNQATDGQANNSCSGLAIPDGFSGPKAVNCSMNEHCSNFTGSKNKNIFLATAIINIYDSHGNIHKGRALLDNGSESNFITKNLVDLLGLKSCRSAVPLSGIGGARLNASLFTTATIQSCHSSYRRALDFIVLPKITQNLPSQNVDISRFPIPQDINLADPQFSIANKIDMLLSAEIFFNILCDGKITIGPSFPVIQNTLFGWIVSGPIYSEPENDLSMRQSFVVSTLEDDLRKFWEIENVASKPLLSIDENKAEKIYSETTKRLSDGTYEVELPFRKSPDLLKSNKHLAEIRFLNLEKQLLKKPLLREAYSDFIKEYIKMGHMIPLERDDGHGYYLPHHCVVKSDALTTKVRVVFDGSCKTGSGLSLNDLLLVGPKIQEDLCSIMMRFRTHNIALHADIEKMYRMVKMAPSHFKYQKILWRNCPKEPIKTYCLTTVTYGTASASFSAVRTLQQLALDEGHKFPHAKEKLLSDFYVDDLLTGGKSVNDVMTLIKEMKHFLSLGNFKLHKFFSNDPHIFENNSEDILSFDNDLTLKTLGILWHPKYDQFLFFLQPLKTTSTTKRTILSEIGKIFDPLGLVNPVILRAKLLMQELWQLKLSWDEPLPESVILSWTQYGEDLSTLSLLKINRKISDFPCSVAYELHGFCDSSEVAYAACFYLVSVDPVGKRCSNLICAKSRVAPLKRISLPRLELCAALLLSDLYLRVKIGLKNISFTLENFWSDSEIVLSWIASPSSKFKTFVANRVGEIHTNTNPRAWRYVPSRENPADLNTRGVTAKFLLDSDLWFHGPNWLIESNLDHWPKLFKNYDSNLVESEVKSVSTVVYVTTRRTDDQFLENYSEFRKLVRIMALCLRFKSNCLQADKNKRIFGPLSTSEHRSATEVLIKLVQSSSFPSELNLLQNKQPINKHSKIFNLNPFLDKNNIIRVGGRLEMSGIPFERKYPILLPSSHLTKIIMSSIHRENLHCGMHALIAATRQFYWPLNIKAIARKIVHQCITCFRARPKTLSQIMGYLPKERVTPSRPFSVCGVDYAGPIEIKSGYTKKSSIIKAYIAVFVCFSTRAVHLELVTSLSTESFFSSLNRFISRRGVPSFIHSDNATTFRGAAGELSKFFKTFSGEIINFSTSKNIEWRFIPPNSPHFGGLWESCVKSMKHHLKRVTKGAILNYEEMSTLLCRIESVLNSRPLTPISDDPNDLSFLTPALFLIGESFQALPSNDNINISENRLNRWQRVERMVQHLWQRWSKEYLNELRQRPKWKSPSPSLKLGTLVLLRENNIPPLKWPIGRVISVDAGQDGHIRVATVKTATGEYKRSIHRLCPLPID